MANFSKLSVAYAETGSSSLASWANFFHAGTDWLMLWQLLDDRKRRPEYYPLFYVEPHIVHFCVELFTKSLIAHKYKDFDSRKNSHKTLNNMREYRDSSPMFERILNDSVLSNLVEEYQKTVDTRFGETIVVIESGETKQMMDLAYEMREEMCKKTGLR